MMHKIAIISDIHGNLTALEAVLADAITQNVTEYWVLGDLFMIGPGSAELLNQLRNLPNVTFIKGNWDYAFLNAPFSDFNDPTNVYGSTLAKYHYEQLDEDAITFIRKMPDLLIKEIHGFKFLLCHHLPNKMYGGDLMPYEDQANFDLLFTDHQVDVAVYGHIHRQLMRYSRTGQLIINPGSVYPYTVATDSEKRHLGTKARYAMIEIDEAGIGDILFKKVAYDLEKEIAFAKACNLPYADFYAEGLRMGKSYTHNKEILKQVNEQRGYQEEIMTYFNRGEK